jgi:flagellar biosynthetic protein FliP
MTTAETTRSTGRKVARFAWHYAEMVIAMLVGMIVLAPLWPTAWTARADVGALVMATDMTVAMVAAMALRRHSRPRIAEMAAAMYLPFLLLLVPYWLGVLSGMGLMVAGHVIMFPLMLAAMVWRRDEYWH